MFHRGAWTCMNNTFHFVLLRVLSVGVSSATFGVSFEVFGLLTLNFCVWGRGYPDGLTDEV